MNPPKSPIWVGVRDAIPMLNIGKERPKASSEKTLQLIGRP
jgi:hypothetical protein